MEGRQASSHKKLPYVRLSANSANAVRVHLVQNMTDDDTVLGKRVREASANSGDDDTDVGPMPDSNATREEDDDEDDDVGPMPAPEAKKKKRKGSSLDMRLKRVYKLQLSRLLVLEHEKLYLDHLPAGNRYFKSFMHRDTINFVTVTKSATITVILSGSLTHLMIQN